MPCLRGGSILVRLEKVPATCITCHTNHKTGWFDAMTGRMHELDGVGERARSHNMERRARLKGAAFSSFNRALCGYVFILLCGNPHVISQSTCFDTIQLYAWIN